MKEIKLTQGKVAIVDDEDFERVNQFKWRYSSSGSRNTGYAMRFDKQITLANGKKKRPQMVMHRFILGLENDNKNFVDHIDRNGLNNKKDNLRLCSASQNQQNAVSRKNSKSIYKGVSFHNKNKKFIAYITINKKFQYLGSFDDEIEAAKTYDEKAKESFGEFALLNFPED